MKKLNESIDASRGQMLRYMFVLLMIILVCLVQSPTLPVIVGIIAGFFFGTFFTLYGMEDEDLDRLCSREAEEDQAG